VSERAELRGLDRICVAVVKGLCGIWAHKTSSIVLTVVSVARDSFTSSSCSFPASAAVDTTTGNVAAWGAATTGIVTSGLLFSFTALSFARAVSVAALCFVEAARIDFPCNVWWRWEIANRGWIENELDSDEYCDEFSGDEYSEYGWAYSEEYSDGTVISTTTSTVLSAVMSTVMKTTMSRVMSTVVKPVAVVVAVVVVVVVEVVVVQGVVAAVVRLAIAFAPGWIQAESRMNRGWIEDE
jgi:hypothetical protein